MMEPSQRQGRKLIAASFGLLFALRCNVYDSSLLGMGAAHGGAGNVAGRSGTSGSSGVEEAAGDDGFAGEINGDTGGASTAGHAETAGSIEPGGVVDHGGSAGDSNGGGGNAGTASAGGVAGSGGGGVSGSSGGGPAQTANGCAKLSVPLAAATDKAHFVIGLSSAADLSAATVSMRLYVKAGTGGTIFNYVQDSGTFHFLGVAPAQRRELNSFSGWSTLTWDVGAEPDAAGTGIVKTSIKSIGIEINAQPSAAWSNPTVVYVDSVTVTTPTLTFTFDASSSVSSSNTTGALWLNSNGSDTTATGASLSWQATCP